MMTLTMLIEPMRIANYLAPRPLFEWSFISPDSGEVTASNGLSVTCAALDRPGNAASGMVFVCGSWGAEHYEDQHLFRWLRQQSRAGKQIVAVELGVYALAKAGLLVDQKVTTHWSMMAGLAEAFPRLQVVEQLYTADGAFMTGSGGIVGVVLMIFIVLMLLGRL